MHIFAYIFEDEAFAYFFIEGKMCAFTLIDTNKTLQYTKNLHSCASMDVYQINKKSFIKIHIYFQIR